MNKSISLRAASALDDLHCHDGEVECPSPLFPAGPDGDSSGDPDSANPSVPDPPALIAPDQAGAFSIGPSSLLCIHRPGGCQPDAFAIFRQADGNIFFTPAEPGGSPHRLSPQPLPPDTAAVAVGSYLVFRTPDSLLYALFDGSDYIWLGETPPPPSAGVSARQMALPPFSYTDEEFPVINVEAPIGDEAPSLVLDWLAGRSEECGASVRRVIIRAVSDSLALFLKAVDAASLYFMPVAVAVCRRLNDGRLWQASPVSRIAADNSSLTMKIVTAGCRDGRLYLSLQLSRRPFSLQVDSSADSLSVPWQSLHSGVEAVVAGVLPDFDPADVSMPVWVDTLYRGFRLPLRPAVMPGSIVADSLYEDIAGSGVPDRVFSEVNVLVTVSSRCPDSVSSHLAVSETGIPFLRKYSAETGGNHLFFVTHSLRSHTSGRPGDFPLYLFCDDGIRSLRPSGDTLREVQLVSRYAPVGSRCFATTPGATCFLSSGGVMKIEGGSVSALPSPPAELAAIADRHCRLLYLYKEDALAVYQPGAAQAFIYGFADRKWRRAEIDASCHAVCWPDVWVQSAGGVCGRAGISEAASTVSYVDSSTPNNTPLTSFRTRPVKLGSPFTVKKLSAIHAVWPDGSLLPVSLYGALRPGKWYFLGMSPRGRFNLRGSGWCFFRIESFATPDNLPVINLVYDVEGK